MVLSASMESYIYVSSLNLIILHSIPFLTTITSQSQPTPRIPRRIPSDSNTTQVLLILSSPHAQKTHTSRHQTPPHHASYQTPPSSHQSFCCSHFRRPSRLWYLSSWLFRHRGSLLQRCGLYVRNCYGWGWGSGCYCGV